jgi:hypothetical protein
MDNHEHRTNIRTPPLSGYAVDIVLRRLYQQVFRSIAPQTPTVSVISSL